MVLDGRPIDPCKVEHWIRAFFWRERVTEYDKYLDAGRVEVIEQTYRETAREVAAKHRQMLEDARSVAMTELAKLKERVGNTAFEVVKPSDLTKLVDTIVKLDRLIRGETTESVQLTDMSKLSDEELDQIERVLNRPDPDAEEQTH